LVTNETAVFHDSAGGTHRRDEHDDPNDHKEVSHGPILAPAVVTAR